MIARRQVAVVRCAVLAAFFSIVFAFPAHAQSSGRGRGRPSPPSPSAPPGQPRTDDPSGTASAPLCRIIRFDSIKSEFIDDNEAEYLGYLLAKPLPRGHSVVKLRVPTPDRFTLTIPNHKFECDDYTELLAHGLNCRVKWEETPSVESPRRTTKELSQITFSVVDVEGTIKQITDDLVRLRAKPVNDAPWPHLLEKEYTGSRTAPAARSRAARYLIGRFRYVDELTKVVDEDDWETDLSSFEAGWKVRATVIVGQPHGVLLHMKPVFEEESELSDRR